MSKYKRLLKYIVSAGAICLAMKSFSGCVNRVGESENDFIEKTRLLDENGGDLSKCISSELLDIMKNADYTCINNEFTYTTRGEPVEGKLWCFRADPSRVSYLSQMGTDIVLLANNHVYDYGSESTCDTLDTLRGAGIEYMGAGRNLSEAMKPVYVKIDGMTVAYVAASRAEKNLKTPQATDTEPGILRCYDPELFIEVIKEADKNADIVIANVHWGTERSDVLEDVQLQTGKMYIDAGADVIVGSHSHCLQGIEFYKGKPIIYSLGNFWFDSYTEETMLLLLCYNNEGGEQKLKVQIVPAIHKNATTTIVKDEEEKKRIFSYMENISINVDIDMNGIVTESN